MKPLPTINESSKNQYSMTEGNVDNRFNTHRFSMMMRKFQKKKLAPIATPGLNVGRLQTDPNELLEMEEEEKKANLENEKSLIKIYESNASSLIQKIRDEYDSNGQPTGIPLTVDKRYGFAQFRDTNYVEKSQF